MKCGRSVLLLTHAREALQGKCLAEYVDEIRGDPLHDLIVKDIGRKNVMAVNNNYKSSYESGHQWNTLDTLLLEAYKGAKFEPEGCLRRYFKCWVIFFIVLLIVTIALSIWCVLGKDESETTTVYALVHPNSSQATETISPTLNTT